VQEGKLTGDEAERLKTLASHDTSTLAINALMVFGAAAVSAGMLALNPSFAAGAALGGGHWHPISIEGSRTACLHRKTGRKIGLS
jgi:hypothetical protein